MSNDNKKNEPAPETVAAKTETVKAVPVEPVETKTKQSEQKFSCPFCKKQTKDIAIGAPFHKNELKFQYKKCAVCNHVSVIQLND